jgi:carbonic anhydrase
MKFVMAINCMDGRTQIPVIEWLKKEYGANYVDVITEPGPNKILAENKDRFYIDSIKRRVEISVKKHHSKVIAIIGHYDCARNPVAKEIQLTQIKDSIKAIKSWRFDVHVVGLWVDENWQVSKVS